MIHYEKNVFHISNEHMSYIMHILKNGQLAHVYYGHPIQGDFSTLFHDTDKQAGTCKFYKEDHFFSLADQMMEYPTYGSTDFKQGALVMEEEGNPLFLNLQFDHYEMDNDDTSFLPHTHGKQEETLKIVLKDRYYKIAVSLYYTIYPDSGVIVKKVHIQNQSNHAYHLKKAMSSVLNLRDDHYTLLHFAGNWARERGLQKQNLTQGSVSFESLYGSSSHQSNPGLMLEGDICYATNLIYSGNFLNRVDVNEWGMTRVMSGIHSDGFDYLLKPGDTFKTPEAITAYSLDGLDSLSRIQHAFIKAHIMPARFQKTSMPIACNSWEAFYFDYNEEKLLQLAREAQKIGIECFVLDDGWFGHRDDDRSSLGDWFVNRRKFPQGLGHFAKKIHQMGMQFGLWIEPEMVNEDSLFYAKHPEMVIKPPHTHHSYGRGQLVLDFANPDCVDLIYKQIKAIIEETHPDYLKWDMNRDITEPYSPYLHKMQRPQGELFHRYILGVYRLYQHLTNDYPDMIIEGCAGGGGRFDLGILAYSPMIWTSDDTDAIERLSIQSHTSMMYPLTALSNHVSIVPNHQTGRVISLKTRYDVARFGNLGYELNLLELPESEKEIIKKQIEAYKEMRKHVIKGQFYHLYERENEEMIWALVDKNDIYVAFYRLLAHLDSHPQETLRLPFVDEEALYQDEEGQIYTGSMLKYAGLKKPSLRNGINNKQADFPGDFTSVIYHFQKIS